MRVWKQGSKKRLNVSAHSSASYVFEFLAPKSINEEFEVMYELESSHFAFNYLQDSKAFHKLH